jgi:N-acetyl-gamma-glutamyl-phosphate reductase
MIKIAIVGGAGYTAGELLRILIGHRQAEIVSIVSSSSAGALVSSVHEDLFGDTDLRFSAQLRGDEELIFLCLGHGLSRDFLQKTELNESVKIIDLGNDFRLPEDRNFQGRAFVYGLAELNREAIAGASNIANAGCFATAIQLALLPLAKAGCLSAAVHISAITGSTGAGRGLSETVHFSWRNNNISTYKVFTHQHLGEIKANLQQLQAGFASPLHFVPYRGDFARGIFATVYTPFSGTLAEAQGLYADYYAGHLFTHLSAGEINLKQVVNTNKCLLHLALQDGQLIISSVIDNLVKGASGQAVQNMNLMFGLPEAEGLRLKSLMF